MQFGILGLNKGFYEKDTARRSFFSFGFACGF
jgi:hypothetical protein